MRWRPRQPSQGKESALPLAEGLSVITNGQVSFEALHVHRHVRAFLNGGEREEHNQSLVGAVAIRLLEHLLLDRCFVSTTCVDPALGTSEVTPEEVSLKEALVATSRHVVLAVDSGKLGIRSLLRSVPFERIDLLVTELPPSHEPLGTDRGLVELL